MKNIDTSKKYRLGQLKYNLRKTNVYRSPEGLFYIDYLDPVHDIRREITAGALSEKEAKYIEASLESNPERLRNQIELVGQHADIAGSRIMDIGSGGGKFLSEVVRRGANATGIELNEARACYSMQEYGLNIERRPVEDDYWRRFHGTFDIVTLWDVIEHVNYPYATISAAAKLLKPGGLMFLDTPCRDCFYHRFGQFTYAVSGGRFPTLLNLMYSPHAFGHKQIFSTGEMSQLVKAAGMEVIYMTRIHEHTLPIAHYLRRIFRFDFIAVLASPIAKTALLLCRVRNKMIVVARRS